MKKRIAALLLLLSLIILPLTACKGDTAPKEKSKIYYLYFDTVCTVTDYSGLSGEDFSTLCTLIEDELMRYHRLFDIYNSYSGVTNICDINAAEGESVAVSDELIDFLLYAKEIYTLTGGEVNIALGTVLALWHDEREAASLNPEGARLPDAEKLATLSHHTDIDKLLIDKASGTVRLLDPHMRLDVGALGKGYAAKKIIELLEERGYTSVLLNLGGNVSAVGTKWGGAPFVAGVRNPAPQSSLDRYVATLDIIDASLSTSGDYERFYTVGGVDYHHIIDKDTLMPSDTGFRSVTVLGPDPAVTDALSTALFCLSFDEGRELISSISGYEAFWIFDDGRTEKTEGFKTK